MVNSSEFKKQAKSQLKGRWGSAIGGFFIAVFFFPFIIDIINFFIDGSLSINIIKYSVSIIIRLILIVGTLKFSLHFAKPGKAPFLDDIFSGFKIPLKAVLVYIIMIFCITIGFVLLIVPGIIISLAFSQSLYILIDNNHKSAIECIKDSINMMKGNKKDCLLLSLSFLGWIALMIIPIFFLALFPLPIYVGILYLLILFTGLLWIIPYMNVTFANFYLKVSNDYYGISENKTSNS